MLHSIELEKHVMEQTFTSLDEYTEKLKQLGIQKIAFAQVNEKRAVQKDDNQIEVMQVIHVELLAYKDAVIYKCSLKEDLTSEKLQEIHASLEAQGFDVTKRNRNIT